MQWEISLPHKIRRGFCGRLDNEADVRAEFVWRTYGKVESVSGARREDVQENCFVHLINFLKIHTIIHGVTISQGICDSKCTGSKGLCRDHCTCWDVKNKLSVSDGSSESVHKVKIVLILYKPSYKQRDSLKVPFCYYFYSWFRHFDFSNGLWGKSCWLRTVVDD